MKTAVAAPPEQFILEVGDEQIVLDESFMDFSDFTEKELILVSKSLAGHMFVDGEPTVGATATLLTMKLCRDRDWDQETITEVLTLLIAWLSDELEEV